MQPIAENGNPGAGVLLAAYRPDPRQPLLQRFAADRAAAAEPDLALAAVAAILALTLLWPFASKLFAFGPLHVDDLALTLGAGVVVLVVLEMVKPLLRSHLRS